MIRGKENRNQLLYCIIKFDGNSMNGEGIRPRSLSVSQFNNNNIKGPMKIDNNNNNNK